MAGAVRDGFTLQPRVYIWALRRATADRCWIVLEGLTCLAVIALAAALIPLMLAPMIYAALMIAGSWTIPLVTSYAPHDVAGVDELHQTRRYRGRVASIIAWEHLYHLEHHLFPAVPHHNWPRLARRLDPYLDAQGIRAIKIGF